MRNLFAIGLLLSPITLCAKLGVQELEPFLVPATSVQGDALAGRDLLGDAWRQRGTVGLAEALESAEPGLSLVRKGSMSNDVVLRGLGGDDLSVTLDGRKIYCACSNRMDPPLSHATAETAERVEIAAGPFSLKRSGALGGHINIVSAPIEPGSHGAFDLSYGSYRQNNHSAWLSQTKGDLGLKFQGGYLSGDPYETGSGRAVTELPQGMVAYLPQYLDATAYEAWHFGAEVEWSFDDDSRIRFNALRREDEALLFPGLKMDADSTETTQLGLRYLRDAPAGPFESYALDLFYNDTDHLMTDQRRVSSQYGMGMVPRPAFVLDRGYFMLTDADASNWGLNFDGEIETNRFGRWSVGAEIGQRFWESDNVILNIKNAMLPDVRATSMGVYAQGAYDFKSPWSAEIGLRADHFESQARGDTGLLRARQGTDRDFRQTVPSAFVSFRYQWTEQAALFGGLGSVARTPNPQELYIQVDKPGTNPDWLGNPRLKAPRATELTSGIEWIDESFELRVRVFHTWLDDYIYPVDSGGLQSFDNLDARLYGVECSVRHDFSDSWSAHAGLAWQRGIKKSNTRDDDLAEIPPLRAQLAIQYENAKTVVRLEARASDQQDHIDESLNETSLDEWATLSAYLRRQLDDHWTLAVAVENLFDKDYAMHNAQVRNPFSAFTVVNEPGRILKASLSYEW